MLIDQHLWRGLDNINIESFQSADALRKLLSRLDFGIGNDSWIEDHSHIFGTLYHQDTLKNIQCHLAHPPFQARLDFEMVRQAHSESCQIYCEMNTGDWWWDIQDQLPAGATIVPVICVSDRTH
jgi:hypothetical protein